jgi:hypothetical protein
VFNMQEVQEIEIPSFSKVLRSRPMKIYVAFAMFLGFPRITSYDGANVVEELSPAENLVGSLHAKSASGRALSLNCALEQATTLSKMDSARSLL